MRILILYKIKERNILLEMKRFCNFFTIAYNWKCFCIQIPCSYIDFILGTLLPEQLPSSPCFVSTRWSKTAVVRNTLWVHVWTSQARFLWPPHLPPSWVSRHHHVSIFYQFWKLLNLQINLIRKHLV